MLDFEHCAFVGLIGKVDGLGHNPVKASAFESLEPVECNMPVCGCRCDMDGRPGGFQNRFQRSTTFVKWLATKIAIAFAQQIEEDTGCGSFRGEKIYARGGGMNP